MISNQYENYVKNHRFSLIELMFAVFFVSVIIFGIIRLQTNTIGLSNTQINEVQAHFWANQGLEIAEIVGPDKIDTVCLSFPCTLYVNLNGNAYTLETSVDPDKEDDEDVPAPFVRELTFNAITSPNVTVTELYLQVTSRVDWEDSTGGHNVQADKILVE